MPQSTTAKELQNLISQMMKERQEHQAAIEQIDSTFQSFGISVGMVVGPARRGRKPGRNPGRKPDRPAGKRGPGRPKGSKNQPKAEAAVSAEKPRRGRPPKAKKAAKRAAKKSAKKPRGKFKVSGPDSVMKFVTAAGNKGRTTSEIEQNWKADGRSGHAYITLGQLVKAGTLKKTPVKEGKGSVYTSTVPF